MSQNPVEQEIDEILRRGYSSNIGGDLERLRKQILGIMNRHSFEAGPDVCSIPDARVCDFALYRALKNAEEGK